MDKISTITLPDGNTYRLSDNAEALVKDTVGWTGKNRLKVPASVVTQTINGITLTVTRNSDGEVTEIDANGTATGYVWIQLTDNLWNILDSDTDYILSGCDANGSANKYALQPRITIGSANTALEDSERTFLTDYGAGVTFNLNNLYEAVNHTKVSSSSGILWVGLRINNGATVNHVKFYPMIRRADIIDPTYEPYHESVEVMYEEEIHGVNLFNVEPFTRTDKGITITVADNIITLNGTPSANVGFTIKEYYSSDLADGETYTISDGGISNYSNCYIYINGVKHDGSAVYDVVRLQTKATLKTDFSTYRKYGLGVYIRTEAGTLSNKKFYLMIRKADIDDPTYRPYNPQAIQNQLNAQGVLGAKNLLENKATTQTINGVTFTVNADKSVTVNGTATADIYLNISASQKWAVGSYILSGGVSDNVRLYFKDNPQTKVLAWDKGDSPVFTVSDSLAYNCAIYVRNGYTANNVTLKPMLRLASDPDDTYQPYAMTNRELTEVVTGKSSPKILATASANQTYSSQLSILYAEYQKYSNSQKRKMFIGENGYSDMIYNIASINGTTFSTGHHINPQGIIVDECIRLSTNKIYRLKYNDGVITQTDMSSNTHSSSLVLYIG